MGKETDIKEKVVALFGEARQAGKKVTPPTTIKKTGNINVKGDNNQIAGGDIINQINHKEVTTNRYTPDREKNISAAQAKKLQDLVYRAAERDAGGDEKKIGRKRSKWWKMLKDHFEVPTYHDIPAHLGEHAIKWLQQQIAMNRPKIRRTNNQAWRNDHYRGIWARSREIGMSKGEVYALVAERLGKQVTSLKNLGERDLKKLYHMIMSM